MRTRKLNKKKTDWYWYVLFSVLVIALLLAITLIRLSQANPYVPGEETYVHLQAVNEFTTTSSVTFFDYILVVLTQFMTYRTLVFFFGVIVGLATLLLFLVYVKKYTANLQEQFLAATILLLTPGFLLIHVGVTIYSLLLFLSMLALVLYDRYTYAHLLPLILITLLDSTVGILGFSLLIVKELLGKKKLRAIPTAVLFGVTLLSSQYLPFITTLFDFSRIHATLNEMFFFLGGNYGYPLFLFLLAIVGIYMIRQVKITISVKIIITVGILLSFFFDPLRILLLLPLALYAAKAFIHVLNDSWEISYLHQLTIILLICILAFSFVGAISQGAQGAPTTEQVRAYQFLEDLKGYNQFINESKVLTHQDYSSYIKYFSTLQPYIQKDDPQTILLANELFQTKRYDKIESFFQEQDISFVIVDNYMTSGQVWHRPDEGLLFIMDYNPNFKKIYSTGGTTIYYFEPWHASINKTTSS